MMQPDNKKIIEAITIHKTATRKLMQDLLSFGATPHTLEGIIQTMKVLDFCYDQPHECCREVSIANIPIGGMALRRRRTDNENSGIPQELEDAIVAAVRDFEARQNPVTSENEN